MTRALSAWLDCLLVSPPGNGWLVDATRLGSCRGTACEWPRSGRQRRLRMGRLARAAAPLVEPGRVHRRLVDLCDGEPRIPQRSSRCPTGCDWV